MQIVCISCHKENALDKVHFRDDCQFCGQDLHCCKQCQNYDQGSYNECIDPSADRILDKEKANYCDFYIPLQGKGTQSDTAAPNKNDLLAQAEALFKKKKH